MRYLFFILLFPVCFSALPAQQKTLTAADIALWRQPSAPALAPDGGRVAFVIRAADTSSNSWRSHVWLAAAGVPMRQVTFGKESCTAPAWSPDGSMLSFLSTRKAQGRDGDLATGNRSLFALPLDGGGDAQLLASFDSDIEEYVWSPDGQYIAILTGGALPPVAQAEALRREARKLDITVASDSKPGLALWIMESARRKPRKVAELDAGVSALRWLPDSKSLVYQTNYTGEYNDEQKYDIWQVEINGRTRQVTAMAGPETQPSVSPDGRVLAFITQTVPDIEFAKTEISLLDFASGATRRLTGEAVHAVESFAWLSNGSILALFNEGTSAVLREVDVKTGTLRAVTDPGMVVSAPQVNTRGDIAFLADGPQSLLEVYMTHKGGPTAVTRFSDQIRDMRIGKQEVIRVRSRDGLFDIEAVLITPADRKPGAAVPLVLAYHGGPYGDFDHRFQQYYPAHILAAQGIATVMPNVRGSSGYSDVFGQANRYDLGGGDYHDAMDVVDWLIAKGIADSARLAVMGGSYGGYLTNWTISQTQRFKAAVSMFGIFSWLTDWSNSWQPDFELMFLGHHYWEKPLDMNSLWISRAPQTHVRNITTPTLILQGDKDQYTNISNSREMYQALKTLGRKVEFVTYHGAGHGLRTFPNQWIDAMERTVDWVASHVK